MKNQFLIMEKLKDSLKGLDEATKNAEADRAALIARLDAIEEVLVLHEKCIGVLSYKIDKINSKSDLDIDDLISNL